VIGFRQRTLRERLLYRLWPPYGRRRDAALRTAIERLVDDPSLPCMIGDRLIPNGYGIAPGQEQRR
jgi:hypothetical protein